MTAPRFNEASDRTFGISRRAVPAVGICAVAAAVVVIVGLVVDVREVAAAFIVAYTATVSVVLGMLAMLMIAHLTTATWFSPFRSRAETVIGALPALGVVGLLLFLTLPAVYPWVGGPTPAHAYLNVPFFIVRWVVYWALWIAWGELLRAASRASRNGDPRAVHGRFRVLSSSGLVLLAFTMSFAAFDWMMSLTPDWHSTIYGVYWFAGGMIGALALLALFAARRGDSGFPAISTDDVHSLGKLLTTFVLFWLYIGFAQYIVIWSGDLPDEVTWYAVRTNGGWGWVASILIFGTFVFPFLLLLLRVVKRTPALLGAIGVALLALHALDTFWVVMPGVLPVRFWTVVVYAAALMLVAGVAAVASLMRREGAEPRREAPGSADYAGVIKVS